MVRDRRARARRRPGADGSANLRTVELPARARPRPIARVHRWSGRIAFLCTLPVFFHCVTILGFQTPDARVALHAIVGTFFYGVFAAKVLIVRDRSLPGWALPTAGVTLATMLAVLWLTSSLWYFTTVRFGF